MERDKEKKIQSGLNIKSMQMSHKPNTFYGIAPERTQHEYWDQENFYIHQFWHHSHSL